MDDSHSHQHEHNSSAPELALESDNVQYEQSREEVRRRLKTATALCLAFLIVEVTGGLLAGSLAVLSDAAHLLADLASFAIALIANYFASLPSTSQHTYGLQRTESLAALFSMVSLVVLCFGLAVEAIRRMWYLVSLSVPSGGSQDVYEVDGKLMSGIAAIGVLVNVALALVLGEHHVHMPGQTSHDHSHEHTHDHSHDHTATEKDPLVPPEGDFDVLIHNDEVPPPSLPEKKRNVNLHAAYLHVLGDLTQSVAVLIAGLVIWWKPTWGIVDPICTLGFCLLVFYSTLGVLRSSVAVLLEEVPPRISWEQVNNEIRAVPNVTSLHDLHIWCISDGIPCLSVHVFAVDDNCVQALQDINKVCRKHGITHCTIQVQPDSIDECITCGASHPHP